MILSIISMKTLYYNGKIYVNKNNYAKAFVVDNKKFANIFFDKKDYAIKDYENAVDLKGKTVIPGFIDNHNHFLMASRNHNKFNFDNIKSENDLINELKLYLQLHFNSNILYLEGLKLSNLNNLNRITLDKVSVDIPIFIFWSDRHSVLLNTKALKSIKIFHKQLICNDGIVELDSTGLPNGIIRENACNMVRKFLEQQGFKNDVKKMEDMQKKILSFGIHTIATCDITDTSFNSNTAIYQEFEPKRKINIVHQCGLFKLEKIDSFIKKINKNPITATNRQIKIFLDGSIGSKTAALSNKYIQNDTYCDDDKMNHVTNFKAFGIMNFDYEKLMYTVSKINENNIQVVSHCIGDRSAYLCTKVYSDIDSKNKLRNGIIHCQITSNKLIDLMKQANVYVSVQPCFLEDDLNILDKYVPQNLLKESYAFKTMYDKGINLSFSTDAPICHYNPFENIYYAIANKQLNKPFLEWNQKQNFDINDAIKCYTYNAAKFINKENEIGRIQKDYFANFIVLSKDIFNLKDKKEILDVKVEKNFINGVEMLKDL